MRLLRNFFVMFGLMVSFWLPGVAHAQQANGTFENILSQGLIFGNICTAGADCKCRDTGQCELSEILQIFVNISIAILAISGSVALMMFLYGGITWVTSMGEAKRVAEGKEILVRAVIGLAIIFGAYALVNFLIWGITGGASRGTAPGSTIEQTIDSATGGATNASGVVNTQ